MSSKMVVEQLETLGNEMFHAAYVDLAEEIPYSYDWTSSSVWIEFDRSAKRRVNSELRSQLDEYAGKKDRLRQLTARRNSSRFLNAFADELPAGMTTENPYSGERPYFRAEESDGISGFRMKDWFERNHPVLLWAESPNDLREELETRAEEQDWVYEGAYEAWDRNHPNWTDQFHELLNDQNHEFGDLYDEQRELYPEIQTMASTLRPAVYDEAEKIEGGRARHVAKKLGSYLRR